MKYSVEMGMDPSCMHAQGFASGGGRVTWVKRAAGIKAGKDDPGRHAGSTHVARLSKSGMITPVTGLGNTMMDEESERRVFCAARARVHRACMHARPVLDGC